MKKLRTIRLSTYHWRLAKLKAEQCSPPTSRPVWIASAIEEKARKQDEKRGS